MKIFEIGLFSIICLCGVVLAYYKFVKPEAAKKVPEPVPLDYARSFFPVLLLVFVLRSFIAEPFRIPSGSMLSNLEIGDFILVNKFSYGIRLPILQNKVIDTGSPDRGDIVV
ncbi:MAG: signal peptidase I, partial [Gammaproteobacteria bacterium]|nr:signal peptidase I [Gammaproteobacteria bacterium]